jgi:hypothetical protein
VEDEVRTESGCTVLCYRIGGKLLRCDLVLSYMVFLQKLIVSKPLKKFLVFMDLEGSSLYLQKNATDLYF